ncbi:MAG: hypothetical protein JWN40_5530 [Phycisphaerales bacterium]|nr:hypothetical protein [Phycisphaerales bacterium]
MKLTTVATALLLACTLASCNENQPPKAEAPPRTNTLYQALKEGNTTYSSNVANQQTAPGRRELQLPAGAAATPVAGAAKGPVEPAVQIPQGARWTLYCASLAGPDRFTRMSQMKAYLLSKSPFKDWYVVHNEQDSTLFYGFYSSIDKSDRAAAKAHDDHTRIAAWKDETGERPFANCFFTAVTPPTPDAPPEWNLASASDRAYWSVQIAAFRDNPQRKEAAVSMVKQLREKGVEAYYYHGQAISSVCVGTWPADAIKGQDIDGSNAREAASQEDAILVVDSPLPARYQNARMKTNDGQRLVPYVQRTEIIDKSLIATFHDYPYHYVNYEALSKKVKTDEGKMVDRISPSFLIKVPHEAPSLLNGGGGVGGFLNPNGAPPVAPADPSRLPAGAGRLRGIGK